MRLLFLSVLTLVTLTAFAEPSQVPLKPHDPAPAITVEELLQAPSGAQVDLQALKGKVVVLEFWATWCGPCVSAIPHLNELVSDFKDKPVQFLFLTDEERWRVERFLKIRPITGWIGLNPGRSIFERYGVEALPRTIVIDRQGSIAALVGPSDLTENLIENVIDGKQIAPSLNGNTVKPKDAALQPTVEALVRSAKPGNTMRKTPNAITANGARLRDIVSYVYGVSPARTIVESPLADATYDVSFVVPPGKQNSLSEIAGKALEIAFGLQVKREIQEQNVLVLSAPHGTAGLRPSADHEEHAIMSDDGQVASKSVELKRFCDVLEGSLKQPVLDETGIDGLFDVSLYWDAKNPETVKDALHDQLGLELRPERRSIEVLVVSIPDL